MKSMTVIISATLLKEKPFMSESLRDSKNNIKKKNSIVKSKRCDQKDISHVHAMINVSLHYPKTEKK